MKKQRMIPAALLLAAILGGGCTAQNGHIMEIDAKTARARYQDELTITPEEGVSRERTAIIIAPEKEDMVYTLSGYYRGQIVSRTKNTELRLDGVYIEQPAAKAALLCTTKTAITAVRGSENYIVSKGRSYIREGALHGKRDLLLGGSGTLYVKGAVWHGIEGDDVKIRGSGTFYVEGSHRGAALTCESLAVQPEKTFTAYLLNAKTGIKADDHITIASGSFHIYDTGTPIQAPRADIADGALTIKGARK